MTSRQRRPRVEALTPQHATPRTRRRAGTAASPTRKTRRRVPGSIYLNGRRYWWSVRLPGDARRTARPLVPPGARHATTDPATARDLAAQLYADALASARGDAGPADLTVGQVAARYLAHAARYYRDPDGTPTGELANVRAAMAHLADLADLLADAFTARRLKAVRQTMIAAGLARSTINARVRILRRAWRWAASEDLVAPNAYASLATVDGLRRGRTDAPEPRHVRSAPPDAVQRTIAYLPPTLQDMVRLQLLTGMRPGEVCALRPADLDRAGDGDVWWYRPARHKTSHLGVARVVAIGPKAQQLLAAYLDGPTDAPVFNPRRAQAERLRRLRLLRHTTVPPSQQHRRKAGARRLGNRYDSRSYYHAIQYAIARANRQADRHGLPPVPHWHPHQLRHTAAAAVRREYGDLGRDAVRALLGQRSLPIGDRYSADALDEALLRSIAQRLG